MWGILLVVFLVMPTNVIVLLALLLCAKWLRKDEKKHPEKYRERKKDNFCYWIDD
ncbi:MAG: hypothetical protein HFI80_11185 [Lachnospiraceae bacterium]|jgi:hypothetical protein|nr:hypothetical protein [Lachnospiraceae bacterium]MCI9662075.1 hypothetical protein [Lachnospiraceae bacterium]